MEQGEIPSYLDTEEDQQFADAERAGTQVPQLAAVLKGADNERAAALREEADERVRDPAEYVPTTAARQLYDFARHHPEIVAEEADTLVAQLDSNEAEIRRRIAFAVMYASTEPEPFVEYAPTLIIHLNDDDSVVRGSAAFALGEIATVAPDEVVPAVDDLISLLDDPDAKTDALEALARIGDEQPQAITSAAQSVCQHFQDVSSVIVDPEPDEIVFRVSALEVIASIALVAPEMIEDVSEALKQAVWSGSVSVRVQATDTIGVLITERPETFTPLETHLSNGLDSEEPRVQRAAVLAYLWIASTAPAVVDDPGAIADRLEGLNETFDIPTDDIEDAIQAFNGVGEESH